MITNCGELKPGDNWNIEENDGTLDVYPPYPDDWDTDFNELKVHFFYQTCRILILKH